MSATLSKGNNFPETLVSEIFNKVRGKSSLAKLSGQKPIPFNGSKEFTFTLDKEIDIVAENGAKSNGGATITPVTIIPIKVEYGARVSDEFMTASEEAALSILEQWTDGFARKLARGIDIMAIHGLNPRTGAASTAVIGNNHFDYALANYASGANVIELDNAIPVDTSIDTAIAKITDVGYDATGMMLSPATRSAIAALSISGARKYPDFAWGATPASLGSMTLDTNSTLTFGSSDDAALVGDFQNAFKWGFAKEMPLKVIEYGNPDNDSTLGDLQGHNQVYLRSEAYIGWAILDPAAFALVVEEST